MNKKPFGLGCGILVGMSICLLAIGGAALLWSFGNFGESEKIQTPKAEVVISPTAAMIPLVRNTPTQLQLQPAVKATNFPISGGLPVQAVVKISAIWEGKELWTGSGTVITPDGLILTNAHVALAEKPYRIDGLLISFTEKEDKPPVARYYAEVMQADPDLDIAVLRINTDIDGNPVDRNTLNLPYVKLGNSDELHIGAPLIILGYPAIGGATITLTRGDVAGFTSQEPYGDRAFIKTSATITGGNSGGLAANEKGELVGIPTQMGFGGQGEAVDCRPLADTNRDGVIDEYDSCVPGGGFINALRPVNLALPLIEAAKRGEVAVGSSKPAEQVAESGTILYYDDFSDPRSGWENVSDSTGATKYLNGQYIIQVLEPQTFVWSSPKDKLFESVLISVLAAPIRSAGDEDFGVLCHYQDNKHFTALEISSDGYFSIWVIDGKQRYALVDWQPSLIIPTDGSIVHLQAGCTNTKAVLGVNGEIVASVENQFPDQGGVGLIAGTWNQAGIIVAFDEFKVYKP